MEETNLKFINGENISFEILVKIELITKETDKKNIE